MFTLNNYFTKLLIISALFIVALFVSVFIASKQARAQFYPGTVDSVSSSMSVDQNTFTFSASGMGPCDDDIDPTRPCLRSEYVDYAVNFAVQKIINNAYAGDQWAGYAYWGPQKPYWDFPGAASQVSPPGLNGSIDSSSWPSGTYRFCATLEGSVTAYFPQDHYATSSLCTGVFTVTRAPSFTCSVTPTQTIDPGSSAAYSIDTIPISGFNSPVTFSSSISGPAGTSPTISFSNDGQVPAATTIANVSSTVSTTAGTYSIIFIGTGGGQTVQCTPVAQLVVNPLPPDFQLTLSPTTGVTSKPNRSNIGATLTYTVVAVCTGGLTGPITNLAATTTFTGLTLQLGATSIACGGSTTLTVTGSPPAQETSSTLIELDSQYGVTESIRVTGQAQI